MIIKELAVVAHTYTDKNGEQKNVWKSVGAMHTTQDGKEYIVLDPMVNLAAIPRKEGDNRVFVSMFEPKAKQAADKAGVPPSKQHQGSDDLEQDVPF